MEEEESLLQFHEMGIDDRILKAIADQGWAEPTLIQEKAIPLALSGKDVLARARTGSGKTAAYAIPLVQKILDSKNNVKVQSVKSVVLTPTKELCKQAHKNICDLCSSCSRDVRTVDVSGQVAMEAQKPLLMEKPDIVVGTPSRLLQHLKAGNLSLKDTLEMLVIDEADLIFSLGYEDDVKELTSHLPKIYQAFLMSATLSDDVKALKKLVLHSPVILKLEEPQLPEVSQLMQYHIKCEEVDKFVLIYTLLKLKLIVGKSIIFVNTVDRCYRLKLFLEQFNIRTCVVNSELPVNSRCHIVSQFNDGLYDIVIAADEAVLQDPGTPSVKKNKKRKRDKESGVSRGIDFQRVSNVINFDFPPDGDSYIHRVGRTARGKQQGTALSFVSVKEMDLLQEVEKQLADTYSQVDNVFKPYQFKMDEIEGFRYRAKDAMQAVTSVAVREARLKEIRAEILNSQKLKSYFEDNPRDLQLLRHDKALHTVKLQEHLKNVPDYIVPKTLRKGGRKQNRGPKRAGNPKSNPRPLTKGQMKFQKKKADPLKSFQFEGLKSKRKKKL